MVSAYILTDEITLQHSSLKNHPEVKSRISSIIKIAKEANFLIEQHNLTNNSKKEEKTLKIISKVHSESHVRRVKSSQDNTLTKFDFNCIANKYTYLAALASVNITLEAATRCTQYDSFFALSRPPGHHATKKRIMGFCYFNNIAVASNELIRTGKCKKIAIIDFDFHYGNGTANIFWNNPNVLYISIHADPASNYPNSGFIEELGGSKAIGFNICIPFARGSGNNDFVKYFQTIIHPILREFRPDKIGVSVGFDGFEHDPIGDGFIRYTSKGFSQIGYLIHQFASEYKIPVFHTLEGGYNIKKLPELTINYFSNWMEDKNVQIPNNPKINPRQQHSLHYLKKVLSDYWDL